jgi:MFS superfamily sulfate permease-like transporter
MLLSKIKYWFPMQNVHYPTAYFVAALISLLTSFILHFTTSYNLILAAIIFCINLFTLILCLITLYKTVSNLESLQELESNAINIKKVRHTEQVHIALQWSTLVMMLLTVVSLL